MELHHTVFGEDFDEFAKRYKFNYFMHLLIFVMAGCSGVVHEGFELIKNSVMNTDAKPYFLMFYSDCCGVSVTRRGPPITSWRSRASARSISTSPDF